MNFKRIGRHLFMTQGQVRRAFPRSALKMIEGAIKASETEHTGEIRFVVEGGIPGIDGKQPEVIAVAVVAQMLQVAGSRTGPADNAPALRPPQR